jgi:hypothetical protein
MLTFLATVKEKVTQAFFVWAGMIFLAGAVFAMDGRIDQRVGQAIDDLEIRQINQKIEFYIMKENMAPQTVTPDDRVNRAVLEHQLKQKQEGTK